ncbi:glycoside hydrolase family 2 TIM barrel-domain containing protein [Mucilaginibacter sp. OK098]|uniref:glycoside hydrolase family 2 TIM barrel-domain containing protein n=1 Tax=Mucilaginibacter sp. OK098 TaxID=1855297 RepID=UPI00091C5FD4|nr:glycoside hydrolase family 2 TIM barrel-domain containing protein [Mucilaginibacter sp. OK098]SHN11886.1 beta-galactosidase [Mucilaginibacter sp. OK098]
MFKNQIAKTVLILIFAFSGKAAIAQMRSASWLTKTDTAFIPKEIEDPECIGINKLPAHATLMPYANLTEALKANRHASTYAKTLNGLWKFNWVGWPQQRPVDFYKTTYNVDKWANIKVPSNWQIEGYGTPYYSNYNYIFQKDFPRVMTTPPVSFTAYKERNPVGSYRRNFEVPANWNGRRIFVTFDGVDAGFFLWVNGKKVGYSVNSRNAADFDITNFVKPGSNVIAVEVYRFTTGTYLEDQDMWRLSGIFRNVTLWSSPQQHIRDFFVKTNFDGAFNNATLEVVGKVKNFGNVATKPRRLAVDLYDNDKLVDNAKGSVEIPALKPGAEVALTVQIPVIHPRKWTAETPALYTTVISIKDKDQTIETVSTRTGFRKVEIKGRIFLVNGVPVKLKGVNRHENWPDVGHAITEAQMIKDIVLIKQANCNHVRTCHYSDDPRWYELCDEYGIYLVAEANLECHGAWDEFNEDPRIKAAIIDRNVANVENFKNHPSVIIWSLGNECGSGGSNFRAALNIIKGIDPDRPTHYQGFGIGDQNPADMDSEMYTSLDQVEKYATDDKLTKPFYLCEYAHAMFNSMGSVADYNDLFDKYPNLLGGCIWEWQDQGIYNKFDPKHPIIAFGGGFGETPNDHYFIHKGVVFSDRSLKPHFPELKHAYQWISIKPADLSKGIINIHNRYQFISLDGFAASWSLTENGLEISKGTLPVGHITPGKSEDVKVPYQFTPKPGAEYFLRVSFITTKDELWAKNGYEIASQQLALPVVGAVAAESEKNVSAPVKASNDDNNIYVDGKDFSLVFSKTKGTFTEIKSHNNNMLTGQGGPMLHLWRAPHRKDDMWANESWDKYGLKKLVWSVTKTSFKQKDDNNVEIRAELEGKGENGFVVTHKVDYEISGDGTIKVGNDVSFNNTTIPLARIGVRFMLDKDYNQFNYFGRGPMENYSDRKLGFDVGQYQSTVAQQLTPYEKPMEAGNHEDVRWARVSSNTGSSFTVKKDTALLQVAALPYSDEEMENVEYRIDLPKSKATVVCIDAHTLGVGSYSCGPIPMASCIPLSEPQKFSYIINIK